MGLHEAATRPLPGLIEAPSFLLAVAARAEGRLDLGNSGSGSGRVGAMSLEGLVCLLHGAVLLAQHGADRTKWVRPHGPRGGTSKAEASP